MEKGFAGTAAAMSYALQHFYEYLLVVHPSADACAQLMEEKQYFFETYNERVAIKSQPHITVANFFAKEEMEDTIIRYMHRIMGMQQAFNVTINNFSGFPPHTVYARVQDYASFRQLAAALLPVDHYVKGNGCPPAKFITHPHVTIARRLSAEVYNKAMFEFSQRTFFASFKVQELVLLKRRNQFDKCTQLTVFKLL
ncbi:2'-5' RNA ligase family protein [Panacibacter sp. DH6]|uniref:2'-5' RNA ligase family protein n=1 Tax=Panacibacter microcysteis TaxID=2793269 RepID=A0A931E1X1_9BACT|nr:2'-5' RNA ligase family protein [Panacibacter microcysteis]MBG9375558.1 2'-5' RNA ligase family protein [Panacibacter microcysteis]